MRKVTILITLLALIVSLTGCGDPTYKAIDPGDFGYYDGGYSKIRNKAYVASYYWNLEESAKTFRVPDEYDGIPITTLGGYAGAPSPFCFDYDPRGLVKGSVWDKMYYSYNSPKIKALLAENAEVIYVDFNVTLGKNIREICEIDIYGAYILEVYSDVGIEYYIVVNRVYFNVDSANKVFYSKDGKLYEKGSDKLISDYITYHDFILK